MIVSGLALLLVLTPMLASIPVRGADGKARVAAGSGLVIVFSSPRLEQLPAFSPPTAVSDDLPAPVAKGGKTCYSNCTPDLEVSWASSGPAEVVAYWCGHEHPCVAGQMDWIMEGTGSHGEMIFQGNLGDEYLITTTKNISLEWGMPNLLLVGLLVLSGFTVLFAGLFVLLWASGPSERDRSYSGKLPRPYALTLRSPPLPSSPAPVGPPTSPRAFRLGPPAGP